MNRGPWVLLYKGHSVGPFKTAWKALRFKKVNAPIFDNYKAVREGVA